MVFVRIQMFLFDQHVCSSMDLLWAGVVWSPSYLGTPWIWCGNCSSDRTLVFLMSCRSQETRASRHIEKCLCGAPEILGVIKFFFALIDEISYDFEHARLFHISTVQINEVLLFANISIKIRRDALSPQHINHFVL